MDVVSKECLGFLRNKENNVKKKENLLSKAETSIIRNIGSDGMTNKERQIIENLKQDLYNEEFNEADIMREQLFMTQLMHDIEKTLGGYNLPYVEAEIRLKADTEKYFNYSGILEEKIGAIHEENDDKHSLRQKRVHNENKLFKAKEKYATFTKDFAPLYNSIKERENKMSITEKAKEQLIDKVAELNKKVAELQKELNESHKEKVDLKIQLEQALKQAEAQLEEAYQVNEAFQTNNLEIEHDENKVVQIKDEIENIDVDCSVEIDPLLIEIDDLKLQIKQKDEEINILDAEKGWLLQQNVAQSVEIGTLKGKLRVWEANLVKFKQLVKSLANHVGYVLDESMLNPTKMLNANGETNENPLVPLITKLQDITAWVKEQDELVPEPVTEEVIVEVEKEHSHMPYILGGALLTALALTMRK